ncbi:hypothetical protein [Cohnella herbarum]|uniref:Uncharacterized protein n=1 Tax=Cohnella herbarum TaxID=2728023 RepID=A0A7Z2VPB1_9BACL|nr:hypothetical protein [Cohnella herbarum]QJD86505.1 hypothetical protein HH215_27290 [Cohnella herbarum]
MGITDRVKLSQWDALMLESLRGQGWTNEELIRRVREGELPEDESDFHFKYETLTSFANEEPATFEAAVTQGYRIKYNTVRGIRSWILVRFGREPELLLEEGREAVHASLTLDEKALVESVLSYGWAVHAEGEDGPSSRDVATYRIEPIQR